METSNSPLGSIAHKVSAQSPRSSAKEGSRSFAPQKRSKSRALPKILHIDTDDIDNPLAGGQPERTFQVNTRLKKRFDITVLTSVYKGCHRNMRRGGITFKRLGFRIPRFGLSPHLSFLLAYRKRLRKIPHDLVVEEFMPPFGLCGAAGKSDKPVVLIVQWYFFEQWEKRYKLPFRKIFERIARSGKYRDIVVLTEDMELELKPHFPKANFHVIGNGLPDEAYHGETSSGEYAFYLGRLDIHHKGLDLLLDAWSREPKKMRIPLVLAGSGPDRGQIEKKISALGMSDLISLTGKVYGEEKYALIRKSRFVVMPSRYETYGLSALEAMASSKPVLSFDIPHLRRVVRNKFGKRVTAFDTEAFAREATAMWLDAPYCVNLGSAGHQYALQQRWDKVADRHSELYQSILQREA